MKLHSTRVYQIESQVDLPNLSYLDSNSILPEVQPGANTNLFKNYLWKLKR